MTSEPRTPARTGGMAVQQWLASSLPHLAEEVTARLIASIPVYSRLPVEQLRSEVKRTVDIGIRGFAEVLRTGQLPSPERLEYLRATAASRAEDGIPINAVIHAHHMAARMCVDMLVPRAEELDLPDVLTTQGLLLDYLGLITSSISAGYLDEHTAEQNESSAARHALLTALLAGHDPAADAARAELAVPAGYFVVALTVGPHADELSPGVDGRIAARRKVRRLRTEIDRRLGQTALLRLNGDEGLVLLPHRTAPDALGAEDWDWLEHLIASLSEACGAVIVAGVQPAAPADVPEAARLAEELRELAVSSGRPGGTYRLEDLSLEYQLSRPGRALDHLAGLLAPVRERPDLLLTLRTFLNTGFNRRRTASLLRVHHNTVDYRLGRIAALTGLDIGNAADLITLYAALLAAGDESRAA
ncbi:helix-turn-helix domain-containing protein [Streptomyces sp. DSM 44917]|uniref:Helix-turn-helix domain-containing protein n=1 Tax=Streptomyces boetiae TaxID=3075541 RepID=A0ABU2L9N4_9ACTN|nr:helix-turn-helix domain-containing protein [Streptomyces sp. DSM 44917]MDT0308279.1 helix-turn-helix domain-containing protein [Streptomyces sp. DSM 44917]